MLSARIRALPAALCWLAGLGWWAGAPVAVRADEPGEVVAVSAKTTPTYKRAKLPDGSFRPEAYTFGEGGHFSGPMRDLTIDKLQFLDVAKVMVGPLAERQYLPSKDQKEIKLLVMVYWGTTAGAGGAAGTIAAQNLDATSHAHEVARQDYAQMVAARAALPIIAPNGQKGSSSGVASGRQALNPTNSANWGMVDAPLELLAKDPELLGAKLEVIRAQAALDSALTVSTAENRERDRETLEKARLLGYDAALSQTDNLEFTARGIRRRDLLDELEDGRYYVVLMAYDFQTLMKEKKHQLLWETRFSVRERGVDFSKELAAMTEKASRYFGEDSHGLVRKKLPEGNVVLGPLEIGAVVPEKK